MSDENEIRIYSTKTLLIEVGNIPSEKLKLWKRWQNDTDCSPWHLLVTGPEPVGEGLYKKGRSRTKAIWTRKQGKRALKVLKAILDDETQTKIILNGVEREVTGRFLTYEGLMDLLRPDGAIYPLLTVVYKAGEKSGTLVPGRAGVVLSDGMVITAVDTGAA